MAKRTYYIFTSDHSGAPIASRLIDEGEKAVLVLIHPTVKNGKMNLPKTPEQAKENQVKVEYLNKNGNGIVPKMWAREAMNKITKKDYCIWDQIYAPQISEALWKRGMKVLGGSKAGFMLETERKQTLNMLGKLGFDIPEQKYFGPNSSEQGIKFLEQAKDKTLYVLKSDQPKVQTLVAEESNDDLIKKLSSEKSDIDQDGFLLQQRVNGIELAVETYYSNGQPVLSNVDLEAKYKYNETSKVMTGCSFGLTWVIPVDHPLRKKLNEPMDSFIKKYIGTGLIDISVIYEPKEDKYYVLEVCGSRFAYNAFYTTMELLNIPIGEFFQKYMDGEFKGDIGHKIFKPEYGASLRLFNDGNSPDQMIAIDKEYKEHCWLWDCKKESGKLMTTGGEHGDSLGIITSHADTPEGAFAKIRTLYSKVHMATMWARDDYDSTDEINLPLSRFHALEKLKLI